MKTVRLMCCSLHPPLVAPNILTINIQNFDTFNLGSIKGQQGWNPGMWSGFDQAITQVRQERRRGTGDGASLPRMHTGSLAALLFFLGRQQPRVAHLGRQQHGWLWRPAVVPPRAAVGGRDGRPKLRQHQRACHGQQHLLCGERVWGSGRERGEGTPRLSRHPAPPHTLNHHRPHHPTTPPPLAPP